MTDNQYRPDSGGNPGYEPGDVNIRKIVLLIIAGAVILALILIGLEQYFGYVADQEEYKMVLEPPSKALVELRQRDQQILTSYGVVDSSAGTYRIPVDSAMQIILRESHRGTDTKK